MSANLDIELLRTFHAILRFGRFLAAASHLNRSPSAVSTHVRRLEELAGGRLFERDNQSVRLTAGAAVPAPDCRAAGDPRPRARRVAQTGRAAAGALRHFRGIRRQAARPPPATPRRGTAGAGAGGAHRRRQRQAGRTPAARPAGPRPAGASARRPPYDGHSREIGGTQPVWVAGHGLRIDPQRPLPLALHGQGCPYRQALLEALGATGRRWRTVVSSPGAAALEAAIEGGLAIGVIDRARVGRRCACWGRRRLRRTARPPHSPGLRPGRAAAGAGAPRRTDRRGVPALSRYSAGR